MSQPINDFLQAAQAGSIDARAAIMAKYHRQLETLQAKYPHLVRIEQPQMFPEILQEFYVSSAQIEAITKLSRKVIDPIRAELPCVLITDWVRENFPEAIALLAKNAQKAKFLYAMTDVEPLMHKVFCSRLRSVKLPLSLFAKNCVRFQADFVEETQRYRLLKVNGPRFLVNWNSVERHIPQATLSILGSWARDIEELCLSQGVKDRRTVRMPEIEVDWPEGVLPQFWNLSDVSHRINCTSKDSGVRYALNDGWCRHEMERNVVTRYTPGPLIGEVKNWKDYAIGATITVTVPRAIELIGETSLVKATHWNFTTKDIYWQKGTFIADKYQQLYPLPKVA